jgi:hypothetical protein
MDETRMAIKLLFGHGSEDGLDNCRIDVIHDLLEKRGNVFTAFRQAKRKLRQIKDPYEVICDEIIGLFGIECSICNGKRIDCYSFNLIDRLMLGRRYYILF